MMLRSTWPYHDDDPPPSSSWLLYTAVVLLATWAIVWVTLFVALMLRFF